VDAVVHSKHLQGTRCDIELGSAERSIDVENAIVLENIERVRSQDPNWIALKLFYVEVQYILYFIIKNTIVMMIFQKSKNKLTFYQKNLMDWNKCTIVFTSLDAQFNFT
jgi:hypothetical protein